MYEVGFTTSVGKVFKGATSALIPTGKPKKNTGRFRLSKRPREESDASIVNSASSSTVASAEDNLLLESHHHDAIVLGRSLADRGSIYLQPFDASNGQGASTSSSPSSLSSITLAQYNKGLMQKFSGCEGGAHEVCVAFDCSRRFAEQELRRSLLLQHLREAMEMTVGAALFGIDEALTSEKYLTKQLSDRAELQGLIPTLIFESLSLASSNDDADQDPLLLRVEDERYLSFPLSSEPLRQAFTKGLPFAFLEASLSSLPSEKRPAQFVEQSISSPSVAFSASLQQRLHKSVHDVFKAVNAASNSMNITPKGKVFFDFALQHCGIGGEGSSLNTSTDGTLIASAAQWASRFLSAQLVCLGRMFREALCSALKSQQSALQSDSSVEVKKDDMCGEVTFFYGRRAHRITMTNYKKLRALYGACMRNACLVTGGEASELDLRALFPTFFSKKEASDDACHNASTLSRVLSLNVVLEDTFHFRLFSMLERYFALSGCQSQLSNEGGWHAAVPSEVMLAFSLAQGMAMEAFASPLNTASYFFGSAFVDTDCYFGSVGSFFSLPFIKGCIEVNPPFDPTVAVQTIAQIKRCLERSSSLLAAGEVVGTAARLVFSVTIPTTDSTKMAKKETCDAEQEQPVFASAAPKPLQSAAAFVSSVEQSGFLLASRHLQGADAPYRDGNEFVSEGTHFVTRMGTLVATMGTPMTVEHQEGQARALEDIAAAWRALCE